MKRHNLLSEPYLRYTHSSDPQHHRSGFLLELEPVCETDVEQKAKHCSQASLYDIFLDRREQERNFSLQAYLSYKEQHQI